MISSVWGSIIKVRIPFCGVRPQGGNRYNQIFLCGQQCIQTLRADEELRGYGCIINDGLIKMHNLGVKSHGAPQTKILVSGYERLTKRERTVFFSFRL